MDQPRLRCGGRRYVQLQKAGRGGMALRDYHFDDTTPRTP
jgi:hypothetical protein